jgi:hypothetical protein
MKRNQEYPQRSRVSPKCGGEGKKKPVSLGNGLFALWNWPSLGID